MLELIFCFVACVVAGAYLALTPPRFKWLKWALACSLIFALGFLVY